MIRTSAEAVNRLLIDEALGRRRETMQWRMEVQRVPTAIGLVRAGLGLAVLPQSGLTAHQIAGVASVLLRSPSVTCSLGLITLRDRPLSWASALLAQLVSECLKDGPDRSPERF